MAEPPLLHFGARSTGAGWCRRLLTGSASLAFVLEIALALRILAAGSIDSYVHRGAPDRLCVFPDTMIYWGLARTIRAGTTYEYIEWNDIPHFSIRTPGYPLFLAGCQAAFGERTLAVRLVQAVLGVGSVYLVYRLSCRILPPTQIAAEGGSTDIRCWTASLVAAAMAAINPYYSIMSSLILSEAVFVPLMLANLWGFAVLWSERDQSTGRSPANGIVVALASGVAAGMAILVRPSWGLFLPIVLVIWLMDKASDRSDFVSALRHIMVFMLAITLTMTPWWVRNARIYGRFVPTALWMGASLYDGLNPHATGGSDMTFLAQPDVWPMGEQDQDAQLTRRAWNFVRQEPVLTIRLAAVKMARYWSPWPNADAFRTGLSAIAGGMVEIPILGLIALGVWDRRHDRRACVLLAGPILYFCAVHLIFASSMRYRIPAEMPALGLGAMGWIRLRALSRKSHRISLN